MNLNEYVEEVRAKLNARTDKILKERVYALSFDILSVLALSFAQTSSTYSFIFILFILIH